MYKLHFQAMLAVGFPATAARYATAKVRALSSRTCTLVTTLSTDSPEASTHTPELPVP